MTVLNQQKTIQNLKKKGFQGPTGKKHDAYNFLCSDGKRTPITTHVSRGSNHKDLSDALIARMAEQCCLSKGDFVDFARCNLDQHAYECILKIKGEL